MESKTGGEMKSKAVTVRFYLEREADQTAWKQLQQIHLRDHVPLGRAIIHGLNAVKENEFTSNQQIEMTRQLADSILAELQKTLPAFIAGCIAGNRATAPITVSAMPAATHDEMLQESQQTESVEDSEPDFRRSHASWGFAGG